MKIRNAMNYKEFKQQGEVNNQPSKTVPDQTMSIREILTRYAHGLPIDSGKVPIYEGEDFHPDPSKMDLVDRQEYMESVKEELNEIKKKYKPKNKAKNEDSNKNETSEISTNTP
jgi:hypothetical protein